MDETGFLDVADDLSTGSREADWRSATSRAYYSAFHKARRFFLQCGFVVPRAEQSHAFLWLRLSNSGHPDVENAGVQLNQLRRARNQADYDVDTPFHSPECLEHVRMAADIIQLLDDLSKEAAILSRIIDAIKIYERDVLHEVTWQP